MAKAESAYLNSLEDDAGIMDQISDGISQADIARSLGIQPSTLTSWLRSDHERLARAQEARRHSAESWMDKAEAVLKDETMDIQRCKELALHYRKQAMIRNPAEYGDKIDVTGKIDHAHSVSSLFAQIVQQPNLLIGNQADDAILIESGNTGGNTGTTDTE